MAEEKIPSYDDLEGLFVSCMQTAIAQALAEKCRDYPGFEQGGWWAVLKEWDKANTNKYNSTKKSSDENFTRISDITHKCSSIEEFDLQACNKVIVHLEDAREHIFDYFDVTGYDKTKCVNLCRDLIYFRNKYYHRTPDVTEEERQAKFLEAVKNMDSVISLAFSSVLKDEGTTYISEFTCMRIKYESQYIERKYYILDYLDKDKYDLDKFYEACVDVGISKFNKEDGKLYLYSSDLNRDLELLKNRMIKDPDKKKNALDNKEKATAISDESEVAIVKGAYVERTIVDAGNVSHNNSKKILAVIGVVVAVVVIAVLITILVVKGNSDDSDRQSTPEDHSDYKQITQSDSDNNKEENNQIITTGPETTIEKVPEVAPTESNNNSSDDNSVYKEYEKEIKNFQLSDELTKTLYTKTVKVGEETTVLNGVTSQWKNTKLLSANPDIAQVTEDDFILGVSQGEAYIVFDAQTGVQIYLIIVE